MDPGTEEDLVIICWNSFLGGLKALWCRQQNVVDCFDSAVFKTKCEETSWNLKLEANSSFKLVF